MHDMNGKPLNKGDRVVVEFEITDTSATPDFCNVFLTPIAPMQPGDNRTPRAWFNGKQCRKVEP